MLIGNEAEALKLQGFLKERFPKLNSIEIEKNSKQLMELAFLIVRLQIKKHSSFIEPEELNQKKENSP